MIWRCGRLDFDLTEPIVMGVLNVTPDSFSDGGQFGDTRTALAQARRMWAAGAAFIDVGGESTRPGAEELTTAAELARVLPVVEQLVADGMAVSIDSRHAAVTATCLAAGALVINDVSGFRDPAMRQVAAHSSAGCVVMHMLGEPQSMQVDPHYVDVVAEVKSWLLTQAAQLEVLGVAAERICIDPGPGFGKTFQHNLDLLLATADLASLGFPLAAAWSRKSFIGKLTGIPNAADRVDASVAIAVWAAQQGARVLRVHDVEPTVAALRQAGFNLRPPVESAERADA